MMALGYERRNPWPSALLMAGSLLLCLILQAGPATLPGFGQFMPIFPLMALMIWTARRPAWTPPPVLLVVGLLQDLSLGGPLGVWALSYMIAFSLARPRDPDGGGEDVIALSLRFAVLTVIALGVAWLAGSAALGRFTGARALIADGLLTILWFPLAAYVFARRSERPAFRA